MALILLVEDNPDMLMMLTQVLKWGGYEVIAGRSGQEGLDQLDATNHLPDLIISDLSMPDMNGLEFLNKVHTELPSHKRSVPFIFFSTSATPDAIKKAYSMHVQGFFVKPHAMAETKRVLQLIISYWQTCRHPNNRESRQSWNH